ncbi:MAG TPA: phosphatase PAP2 family protein [Puia sp.]|nr:phosphatase PAP2 family protein [Puia sp.]
MKSLQTIFNENRLFFGIYLFFFATGAVILLMLGKATAFVDLNPYHRTTLDSVFAWITFLGDGTFSVIVIAVLLLRRRWSPAVQVTAAFLLSALLAQVLKRLFSMPRPMQFFPAGQYPYFIKGVTHLGFASFPSGHSTTIFALATMLAILTGDRRWKVVYLLAAVLVGYSRIYLGQHFLGDVLMGSCIGIWTSVLVHWVVVRKAQAWPAWVTGDAAGRQIDH